MKFYINVALLLILSFGACDKYKDLKLTEDLSDTCRLRGRIFLLDTLTQHALHVPQASKKVLLFYADATDTINYLYNTTSDAEGYFEFRNLDRDYKYRVVYEEKIAEKIYRADQETYVSNDSVILVMVLAQKKQSGVYLRITDQTGDPVSKASVCIFNNSVAFTSGKCENAAFPATTDAYGRAYVIGMQPGEHYILTSATIGNTVYTSKDTVTIDNTIREISIDIVPHTAVITGVQYLVVDDFGNKISGAQVCLFASRNFFLRDTCEGSNYSDSTSAEGIVSFTGLPSQKLYTIGSLTLSDVTYKHRDSVDIVDGRVLIDTLWLK